MGKKLEIGKTFNDIDDLTSIIVGTIDQKVIDNKDIIEKINIFINENNIQEKVKLLMEE